mgnify:CR=1 FL=1
MFAMDDGTVANHAIIVQDERIAGIHMNHRFVLYIDAFTDDNFVIIAADDDARPQVCSFFYGNLADNRYIICQIGAGINIRPLAAEGINICHTNSSCTISLCYMHLLYTISMAGTKGTAYFRLFRKNSRSSGRMRQAWESSTVMGRMGLQGTPKAR